MDRITPWQELSSEALAALVDDTVVAVLPIGAVEQHGPHLPLSTDIDIVLGLLEAAAPRIEHTVLALPPISVAASTEHSAYPGTLTLDPETTTAVITQIGYSVAQAGIRRLVLLNGHGGNRAAVDTAALSLRREASLLAVRAHYFRFTAPAGVLDDRERRHGLHGGLLETAMMCYLHPDRVQMSRAATASSLGERLDGAGYRHLAPEGEAAFAWLAQDLNPSGTVGDAAGANAELGERLVSHYGAILAGVLDEAACFPLDAFEGL